MPQGRDVLKIPATPTIPLTVRIRHCLTLVSGCYNKISIHHDLVINGLREEAHVAETSNLYKPGAHKVNYYQGALFVAIYVT